MALLESSGLRESSSSGFHGKSDFNKVFGVTIDLDFLVELDDENGLEVFSGLFDIKGQGCNTAFDFRCTSLTLSVFSVVISRTGAKTFALKFK